MSLKCTLFVPSLYQTSLEGISLVKSAVAAAVQAAATALGPPPGPPLALEPPHASISRAC